MRLFKTEITFDDVVSIAIVVLIILMARTHQPLYFYASIGLCLLRINRPEVLLPGYLVSSLSTSYFALSEGVGSGRYFSLLMIISLFLQSLKQTNSISKDRYFTIIVVLLIASLFSTLIGPVGDFVAFMMLLQSLIVLLYLQRLEIDNQRLIALVVISYGLVALSVFFEATTNSIFLLEQRYHGVGADDGEGINANRIAMMLEQCGAICIACFFYYRNYLVKAILLFCTIASAIVIIATGSRTGLIALLAAVAFAVIVLGGIRTKKMIFPILLLLISSYLFIEYLSTLNSPILERFTLSDVEESGGTGRLDGARIIMTEFFPDHFLFGSGIGGANMLYYAGQYHFPNLCHNIILDPLSQLGIVIYSVFLCFLVPAGKRIFEFAKSYPSNCIFVTLLVAVCANGIGETIFYEKHFWNDIALCLLCCKAFNVQN